jgi:hypothetical protein
VEVTKKKRPLGRPRRRWLDNIEMDIKEIGWGEMDWIRIDNQWRALLNTAMDFRVP